MKQIQKKIVGFAVKKPEAEVTAEAPAKEHTCTCQSAADIQQMHESVDRPEVLVGNTYKLKTPLSEHALYVTINDIILNEDTEHEQRRPFEIFINSKNMDQFQWVVALTRVISAVFRKGGDVTFLAEELKAVFDPQGGYFKKGGKYMPSVVAEIGDAIENHLKMIGMIDCPEMDAHRKALIEQKRAEFEEKNAERSAQEASDFPPNAELCKKCMHKSVILMDGCMTCLNCGDSKCG